MTLSFYVYVSRSQKRSIRSPRRKGRSGNRWTKTTCAVTTRAFKRCARPLGEKVSDLFVSFGSVQLFVVRHLDSLSLVVNQVEPEHMYLQGSVTGAHSMVIGRSQRHVEGGSFTLNLLSKRMKVPCFGITNMPRKTILVTLDGSQCEISRLKMLK